MSAEHKPYSSRSTLAQAVWDAAGMIATARGVGNGDASAAWQVFEDALDSLDERMSEDPNYMSMAARNRNLVEQLEAERSRAKAWQEQAEFNVAKLGETLEQLERTENLRLEAVRDWNASIDARERIEEQFEALRRGLFELDRKADAGPVGVDISDYSDEFTAGFLAGQSNAIAEALLLAGGSSTTGVQGFPWAHPSPPAPNPASEPPDGGDIVSEMRDERSEWLAGGYNQESSRSDA